MKRTMIVLGLILSMVLVVSGCTKTVEEEPMPETSGETDMMDKDDGMTEEDSMDGDDMMEEDAMDKDDMMEEDSMESHEDDMEDTIMMTNDGEMAPAFSLMATDGNTYSLDSLKGQKVYLKVWASWCSICLAGLEELDELASGDEDFTVLTVVAPGHNGEMETEAFKTWFAGLDTENIVVLLDEESDLVDALGVRGFPTSVYIGSDGVLISVSPGHKDNATIRTTFEGIY